MSSRLLFQEKLLFQEILNNNIKNLTQLLSKPSIDVNIRCRKTGLTPVLLCVKEKRLSMLKLFIEKCADLNCIDYSYNNSTPLMHAIHTEQIDMIKTLILANADVNEQDSFGRNALCIAMDKYRDNAYRNYEYELFHDCNLRFYANKYHTGENMFELLYNLGCKNVDNPSCLVYALKKGYPADIINDLINKYKVDVNVDGNILSVVNRLYPREMRYIFSTMVKAGFRLDKETATNSLKSALCNVTWSNVDYAMELIVNFGADPNVNNGSILFHILQDERGDIVKMVQQLIDKNIDIKNSKSYNCETFIVYLLDSILHGKKTKKKYDLLVLALENGANIHDKKVAKYMEELAKIPIIEALDILVKYGADTKIIDKYPIKYKYEVEKLNNKIIELELKLKNNK